MTVISQIQALPMVSKISPWNDRVYVNLVGFDSRNHGDRTRKIWIKGNIITIERGKGCCGGEFSASFAAFLRAIEQIATTDRPFSECQNTATYKMEA
jgi:hypothetical protein